ncbi:ribonuclease P protein component 4 [Methanospirillum hungatei]|uniref:ribonuclease P protein component 4 n=1 Tax=Methanospirillum hungatei TaxID=2203 RepID=UPI001B63B048|nr:ribonuclease P protein component 4 [Methanospirillum hungatei]MBP7034803.1 ribonuclease P [Methanospirillum sp.]MBP9009002.1 ribonuclease P [Methanospirillum sp.]HOW05511.1 ribonuclease P protein component 4 [Methanospirillum hungatei]
MSRKGTRSDRKHIAMERISILFSQAESFFSWNQEYSHHCVRSARLIAMKERVRIPPWLRRRYCRRCNAYLVPGVTGRVRIYRGRVIITCLTCGWHRRIPTTRSTNTNGKEKK